MSFTTLIDVAALRGLSAAVLLDCRFDLAAPAAGRQAYLQAHIPGARYADLNEDLAGRVSAGSGRHPLPSPAALARRLAAFGIGKGVQVVAYDQANGAFAARAWWLLRWLGHPQVAVLDGGFCAWTAAGGGCESGEPEVQAAAVPLPHEGTEPVVSSDEVLRGLDDTSRLLVDARAAERYAGTVEPLDPIAGHVPGAVNHPFADNLRPDGRFLAPAELRRRWRERLAGTAPADTILMCGSGVTACHNLLALEVAGLPGARLYAGSWSEWIRDSRRPVKRGTAP
jgi:thiosulfate/3-mercaptopyruvate sulfurtransferase